MPLLSFLGTKAFKYISGGLALLVCLYFFYDKIETVLTNNTVLRENLNEKDKQISILKSNNIAEKLKHKEELKVLEFNIKAETQKEVIQKRVDSFKKDEPFKPVIKRGIKEYEDTNHTPVSFSL